MFRLTSLPQPLHHTTSLKKYMYFKKLIAMVICWVALLTHSELQYIQIITNLCSPAAVELGKPSSIVSNFERMPIANILIKSPNCSARFIIDEDSITRISCVVHNTVQRSTALLPVQFYRFQYLQNPSEASFDASSQLDYRATILQLMNASTFFNRR